MKDLLRITLVQDDVCALEKDLENEHEADLLGAAILGLMVRDEEAREIILSTVATFIEADDKDLKDIVNRSLLAAPPQEHAS